MTIKHETQSLLPPKQEKNLLTLILGMFILLGSCYALVTPVFEASDELWHYPMIRHLADGNPLPVQVYDPALAGPWKQEASQPPLYYYLGAALTFWIDTSDMEQVRWLNPHVDNGIITQDGNTNLAIHDPQANPWQGTLLAVRLVRLFSVLLGAVTVYFTYRIAKEVTPTRPEIALGAAAANAFLPMFLFISGAVNNDNLAIPLASLAVWLMIRMVGKQYSVGSDQYSVGSTGYWILDTRYWLLGSVIGLGLLTKEGTFGLLPLAWGTLFIAAWQRNRQIYNLQSLISLLLRSLLSFAVLLIPVTLIAGWWYIRNIQLYGDFLGWSAFIAVLGQRAHPADLAQLWDERWGFLLSYWGLFGGVNIPLPTWVYHTLNGMLLVAVLGFPVYLWREIKGGKGKVKAQSLIANLFYFVERHFPLVVCLLFSLAVVFGLVQWATTTWSSQGRLVFTALSTLTVLMVVGLVGWMPPRPAAWVMGSVAVFMLVVSAVSPFFIIRPAYQPSLNEVADNLTPIEADFGDTMRLVGYKVGETAVSPGDMVWVTLAWEVLQPMNRDWSVFVHLNDPVLDRPITQRDMFPGQGLLATRLLQPGQHIVNRYLLQIPPTAIAPAALELVVGLYDYQTQERLPLVDHPQSPSALQLAQLSLTAVPGQYPNPVSINFEDEIELVGYGLIPRRVKPGENTQLTVYLQAKRPISADYTLFAQVVNLPGTTRYAAADITLAPPTSSWVVGQVQPITLSLTLAPNTPANVYPLILGFYTQTADGNFDRLRLVTGNGRITNDDFLQLTLIRID